MALLLYYFSFIIPDPSRDGQGFAKGEASEVAIRFIILFFTGYWLVLEGILAWHLRRNYLCFRRIVSLLQVFLNLWILFEHSTKFTGV